ncbi:hypothetical protein BKE38_18030 [Pseudoroseomonas deserti]|uniref:Uncharacterized protein n=1 Tax=Teichococcus deserti TaxID=1817963 RepID=A0A1V2GZT8_9PROT|nr:hypothetical protein [Pseudoroseomonas deserti]ONG50514.1 hypothetical protein BKE38_18030 [Pseudoroseomonas deserti]
MTWQDLPDRFGGLADDRARGDALMAAVFAGARPVVEMEPLAAIARAWEGRLAHAGWAQVVGHLQGMAADDQGLVAAAAGLSLVEGRAAALRWLFGVALSPMRRARQLQALHDTLWRAGLLGPKEAPGFLAACCPSMAEPDEARAIGRARGLLHLLGFGALRPMAFHQAVVEEVALPALLDAAAAGQRALAVDLEAQLSLHWLRREESGAHHARWIGRWAPALAACGRAQALAPLPPVAVAGRPAVAVVAHQANSLAHVQAMLTMLEACARLPSRFSYSVHFLQGRDEAVFARLRAAGVTVVAHQFPVDAPLADMIDVLAMRLRQARVAGVVWLCSPIGLAYAFGRRLAPVQVWWSLKFHAAAAPDADLRLGGFSGQGEAVLVEGIAWRNLPGSIDPQIPADAAEQRAALRARFGGGLLLGSLAREEKIAGPLFQDAIIAILRQLPGARYLYTGRRDLPAFRDRLNAAGVAADFVGWVDTGVFAGVLDLYLDSFPLGGGLTAMQAMVSGVAPVFWAQEPGAPLAGVLDNALHRQRFGDAVPAEERAARDALLRDASGADLLPPLRSVEDYVARAVQLGRDPALRRAVGAAVARYAETFLLDHAAPARAFEAALVSVIPDVTPGAGTARTA